MVKWVFIDIWMYFDKFKFQKSVANINIFSNFKFFIEPYSDVVIKIQHSISLQL